MEEVDQKYYLLRNKQTGKYDSCSDMWWPSNLMNKDEWEEVECHDVGPNAPCSILEKKAEIRARMEILNKDTPTESARHIVGVSPMQPPSPDYNWTKNR